MSYRTLFLAAAAMALTGAANALATVTDPLSYTPDVDKRFVGMPAVDQNLLGANINADGTVAFGVFSPGAQAVRLMLYATDRNTPATDTLYMQGAKDGLWQASLPAVPENRFYNFQVKHDGKWLNPTPGIWAKATGTNGQRAAIVDLRTTDPRGWQDDRGPALKSITDAVIYEMHHRDFSVHPSSGIVNKGKFVALTEAGTTNPNGTPTGIDHLKDLGVTHVHILPSFDYNSVDEANLADHRYNWGYDPANYNVPEGGYSTDPSVPETRIAEMKRMVKALHDAGIGVVMDVVYNHTAQNDDSNFSLTAPGYFYRHRPDGTYSDASGCGNETASERAVMRDFIAASVAYWAKEFHIDGFRFDLMAIHDIETMNRVRQTLDAINPQIIIYGEGWTAGDSPLPPAERALKENVARMPGIAVFSDDIRDAVKGHYSRAEDRGFASGKPGNDETVKIGIVGSTAHPQVDYSLGNNSKFAYAAAPTQIINYVSCHDDLCLTDKLAKSMPGATDSLRQRVAKLAQTIVFTSQGTPFMFAGEEVFRNKKGVHNSYCSPDSINAIDWTLLDTNADQYNYYKELIKVRKAHPAFRMTTAAEVAKNLVFDKTDTPNVISYSLRNHANGDAAAEIKVIFNGSDRPYMAKVPRGNWTVVAADGQIATDGLGTTDGGKTTVAPFSATILTR